MQIKSQQLRCQDPLCAQYTEYHLRVRETHHLNYSDPSINNPLLNNVNSYIQNTHTRKPKHRLDAEWFGNSATRHGHWAYAWIDSVTVEE
jgi:hypothetical protein